MNRLTDRYDSRKGATLFDERLTGWLPLRPDERMDMYRIATECDDPEYLERVAQGVADKARLLSRWVKGDT